MSDVGVKTSSIEGLGLIAAQPSFSVQRIRRINVVREITPASLLREELGERVEKCDFSLFQETCIALLGLVYSVFPKLNVAGSIPASRSIK